MSKTDTTTALTAARQKAGMTLDDALVLVRTLLPEPLWISRAGIGRLEKKDPASFDGGDLIVLGVLADAYGTTVRDISPTAADMLKSVREVVIAGSRCKVRTAVEAAV